ncbi:MAG: quinolinate synthase NadA [Planctomycetota bacterium]|nr:MAG: quinolinate synthase NadA [Planctomycetota bacterium]
MTTEIRDDLELEIEELRRERNAVILAHYYQQADIQDIADYVGDSLSLSRQAAKCDQDVIVFCGVRFMAETAKCLNPERTVVLPDLEASCSLVDGCPPAAFARWRARYPDHVVVTYVNSSLELKAMSDYTCTSSNALQVIEAIPKDRGIIFAPDKNLGAYLARATGRELVLWNGSCMVHEVFSEKHLVQLKVQHPGAKVLAHPECEAGVLEHADYIGSTAGILRFAKESSDRTFLIGTEARMIHAMQKAAPGKEFIPIPTTTGCACNECPHMMRNTMEKLRDCLRDLRPEITIDDDLRRAALRPIEAMFEVCDGAVPTAGD